MSTDLAKPTAAEVVKSARQQESIAMVNQVTELDWKKIPPPMLAQLLAQRPTAAGRKLEPWQAMIFAIRCYELGVSPFSNECWYNEQTNSVNLSFEGKKKVARNQGYRLGTPRYEWKEPRPWPKGRVQILGVEKDIGVTCTISVEVEHGKREDSQYTAWLSEWYMPSNPNWKSRPEHMLQLRAAEKCISFASGVGASEMPGDDDIKNSKLELVEETPTITVKEVEFKENAQ